MLDEKYRMFVDAWRFYRTWYREDKSACNEKYWEDVVEAASELMRKYGENSLCGELACVMLDDLEKDWRNLK